MGEMIRRKLPAAALRPHRIRNQRPREIRRLLYLCRAQKHVRLIAARADEPLGIRRQLRRSIAGGLLHPCREQVRRRLIRLRRLGEIRRCCRLQRIRFIRPRINLRERLYARETLRSPDVVKRLRTLRELHRRSRRQSFQRALRVSSFQQCKPQRIARHRRILVIRSHPQKFPEALHRNGELAVIKSTLAGIQNHQRRIVGSERLRVQSCYRAGKECDAANEACKT